MEDDLDDGSSKENDNGSPYFLLPLLSPTRNKVKGEGEYIKIPCPSVRACVHYLDDIFYSAQTCVIQLGMAMRDHEPEWPSNTRLVC